MRAWAFGSLAAVSSAGYVVLAVFVSFTLSAIVGSLGFCGPVNEKYWGWATWEAAGMILLIAACGAGLAGGTRSGSHVARVIPVICGCIVTLGGLVLFYIVWALQGAPNDVPDEGRWISTTFAMPALIFLSGAAMIIAALIVRPGRLLYGVGMATALGALALGGVAAWIAIEAASC